MDYFFVLLVLFLAAGGVQKGVNASVTCSGRVYLDRNQNQAQDYVRDVRSPEPGVPGVTIQLVDADTTQHSTTTETNGDWAIPGVALGPAVLKIVVPPGHVLTTPPAERNVVVLGTASVFNPTPTGLGLARAQTAQDTLTPGDTVAVAIGGSVFALLVLACCGCFWCHVGMLRRKHTHKVLMVPKN